MLGAAADDPLLLLVDQFEEVFRFAAPPGAGRRRARCMCC